MATRRAMAAPGSEATSSRETPRAIFSGIPSSVTPANKANAETSLPARAMWRSSKVLATTKAVAPATSPSAEGHAPPVLNASSKRSKASAVMSEPLAKAKAAASRNRGGLQ